MSNINKFKTILRALTGACLLHGATAAPALEPSSDLEQHLQGLPKTIEFETHSSGCLFNQADYSGWNGYWYDYDNAMASYSCDSIPDSDKQYHFVPVYSADPADSAQPYYQIISAKSGLCLDMHQVTGNAYFDPCHGGDNQLFSLVDSRLVVKENGKCLDVHMENDNAYFHRCHGGDNQRFSLGVKLDEALLSWDEFTQRSEAQMGRGRHLGASNFANFFETAFFGAEAEKMKKTITNAGTIGYALIVGLQNFDRLRDACHNSDKSEFELILQGKTRKYLSLGLSEKNSSRISSYFFPKDGGRCQSNQQTQQARVKVESEVKVESDVAMSYEQLLLSIVSSQEFPIDSQSVILEQLSFHTNIDRNNLLSSNQSKTVYAQAIAVYHLVNRFLGERYLAGSPDVVDAYHENKEPGAVDPLTKVLDIHYPGIKGYLEMMRTSIREQLGLDRDNLIRKLKVSGPLTNSPAPHYYIGNGDEYHMQSQYGLNEITVKVDKIFGMVLKEHNYDMYLPAGNGDGYLISKHDATMNISIFNGHQEVTHTVHLEKGQLPSFSIHGTPLATHFAVNESSDIEIRIEFIQLLSDVEDLFEHISDTCFADHGSRRLLVGGDGNQDRNHGDNDFCPNAGNNFDLLMTEFHRRRAEERAFDILMTESHRAQGAQRATPHVRDTGADIRIERLIDRVISAAYQSNQQLLIDRLAGEPRSIRLNRAGENTISVNFFNSTGSVHTVTFHAQGRGFTEEDWALLGGIYGSVFPLSTTEITPSIYAEFGRASNYYRTEESNERGPAYQQNEVQIIGGPMRFALEGNDPQMRPRPGDQQDEGQMAPMRSSLEELLGNDLQRPRLDDQQDEGQMAPMRSSLEEPSENDPQRQHRGRGYQEEEKQACADRDSQIGMGQARFSDSSGFVPPRRPPLGIKRNNKAYMRIHSGGAEDEIPDIEESNLGSNVSMRNNDDLPDVQHGTDLCDIPEKSSSHPIKRGGKLSNNEDEYQRAGGSHPAKQPSQQPQEDPDLTENERDRIIRAIDNYEMEGPRTVQLIAQRKVTLSLISRSPTSLKIRLTFHSNGDLQVEYWFRLSDDRLSDGGGS